MKKKLLILGASCEEFDVVKMVKSLGYFTIVTDYYDSWEDNPAKFIADEVWHISWNDIEALETKCREENISGVLGGFSEFRVESMINLCERMNLPCYINHEQLEVTKNKNLFKRKCEEFDISVVKEYDPDDSQLSFPVIIKPTDRGGSIGVNVAYNREDYNSYLEYAYSMSPSKSVVVEDYIGDGVKFDCSYVMSDGKVILVETCDTIMLSKEVGYETLQKAWTFPSRYEKEYIEQIDERMNKMLNSLGMRYGIANISFFYRHGKFYVFEAGFRLGGGHSFDYQRATGGIDYLEMLIKHSLSEPITIHDISTDRGVAITYNIFVQGQIGDVVKGYEGDDIIQKIPGLVTYMKCAYKGMMLKSEKPFKAAMVTVCAEDPDELYRKVEKINNNFFLVLNHGKYGIFSKIEKTEIIDAFYTNN